jgi:hypothetical protein
LTFTHHRLVARLDPAEQRQWLARASAQRWTKRELADALAADAAPLARDVELVRLNVDRERLGCWRDAAVGQGLAFEAWMTSTLDAAASELAMPA